VLIVKRIGGGIGGMHRAALPWDFGGGNMFCVRLVIKVIYLFHYINELIRKVPLFDLSGNYVLLHVPL